MSVTEKILLASVCAAMLGNTLLWWSQIKINRHAENMFRIIGENLGLVDKK